VSPFSTFRGLFNTAPYPPWLMPRSPSKQTFLTARINIEFWRAYLRTTLVSEKVDCAHCNEKSFALELKRTVAVWHQGRSIEFQANALTLSWVCQITEFTLTHILRCVKRKINCDRQLSVVTPSPNRFTTPAPS